MANVLTSIFSFKKVAANIFTGDNIKGVLNYARNEIIEKVSTELTNEQKKAAVDEAVAYYIETKFTSENAIVNFILDKVVELVPTITQLIFNFLKDRIDGLTKKEVA